MLKNIINKKLIIYVLKFLLFFCFLYFGTLAIIGLSAPGGYYSDFIANHLNFISWLRSSLLGTSKLLLSMFGYPIFLEDQYIIRMHNGAAVRMVYSCVGYGVMSFWGAFILANTVLWQKKIVWILSGWIIIWCINVIRICLVLMAANKHWATPLGFDHHTWFNIAAYFFLFTLIYFYDLSEKRNYKTI